jgi:hypothetical protein
MAKLGKSKSAAAGKNSKSASSTKQSNGKKVVDLNKEEENEMESSEGNEVDDETADQNQEKKSNLLKECQKLFGSTDLYKIFDLEKSKATKNDSKKSAAKLIFQMVHIILFIFYFIKSQKSLLQNVAQTSSGQSHWRS